LAGIFASERMSGFAFGEDLVHRLAAVRVLEDADARAHDVPDILLHLLEHFFGKRAGAGGEVVNPPAIRGSGLGGTRGGRGGGRCHGVTPKWDSG
jgi:hypothetical protein